MPWEKSKGKPSYWSILPLNIWLLTKRVVVFRPPRGAAAFVRHPEPPHASQTWAEHKQRNESLLLPRWCISERCPQTLFWSQQSLVVPVKMLLPLHRAALNPGPWLTTTSARPQLAGWHFSERPHQPYQELVASRDDIKCLKSQGVPTKRLPIQCGAWTNNPQVKSLMRYQLS